jgi:hypothetical protein
LCGTFTCEEHGRSHEAASLQSRQTPPPPRTGQPAPLPPTKKRLWTTFVLRLAAVPQPSTAIQTAAAAHGHPAGIRGIIHVHHPLLPLSPFLPNTPIPWKWEATFRPFKAGILMLLKSRPRNTAMAVIDTKAPIAPMNATMRLDFMANSAATKKVLSPISLSPSIQLPFSLAVK